MKRTIILILAGALALAACPIGNENDDDKPGPQPQGELPVTLPKSGAYLNGTAIIMEPLEEDWDVYYTLDGATPDKTGLRYSSTDKPKMQFRDGDTVLTDKITVKAAALKENGELTEVTTEVYTLLVMGKESLSPKMQALSESWKGMTGGQDAAHPLQITLASDITLEDVTFQVPGVETPNAKVSDGLGSLFTAIAESGKYIALDLSAVTWEKIPLCHSTIADVRPGRDRLVSVRFPLSITSVDENAFRNTTGLRKADFKNCSKLTAIDMYAFSTCTNLEEIDFSGCGSLSVIGAYAFSSASSLKALDLSQTGVTNILNNAFQNASRMKYIEFPATLIQCGDYSFQYGYSLDYVRYRNKDMRPYIGWAQYLYYNAKDGTAYNQYPANHYARWPDSQVVLATGKGLVIFTPDTPYWTSGEDNSCYTNSGAAYHIGQHVALSDDLDSLRGDALMAAQEPYRGLSSVTINFTGDNKLGTASGTVTASYKDASNSAVTLTSGTISSGTGSINIWTPTSNLKTLDENTGQALTGRYDRTGTDPTIRWGLHTPATDIWPDAVNGKRLYRGEPNPYPWDVKFAILDLEMQVSDGTTKYLRQQAESNWWRGRDKTRIIDRRTVRYVYVDKMVTIYRHQGAGSGGTCNVLITLKAGWNLWETLEWWPFNAGESVITDAAILDNRPHTIGNVISHGKIPYQRIDIDSDDTGYRPNPIPSNPMKWNPLPWKVTEQPFKYPD